jgi:hypothetical protein
MGSVECWRFFRFPGEGGHGKGRLMAASAWIGGGDFGKVVFRQTL